MQSSPFTRRRTTHQCLLTLHPPPPLQKKTLPEQWHLRQSKWRFINGLVPYMGPPAFTVSRIWIPFLLGRVVQHHALCNVQ